MPLREIARLEARGLQAVYAIGGARLVLSWPARVWLGRPEVWEAAGRWMAAVGGPE